MRYLGLDVHCGATVWCLLDDAGEVVERGKLPTTQAALTELVRRLSEDDELLAGQEVGTMSYFVHDVLTAAGVKLLSFNAHQLRMIASSRKKTDKRDAFWIAKALQTGMTPHPVYVPSGQVRLLRQLLSEREPERSGPTSRLASAGALEITSTTSATRSGRPTEAPRRRVGSSGTPQRSRPTRSPRQLAGR